MKNNHWYYCNNTNAALKANNPNRSDKLDLRTRLIEKLRQPSKNPIHYNFRKGREYQCRVHINNIRIKKEKLQRLPHEQATKCNKSFLVSRQDRNTKYQPRNITFTKQPSPTLQTAKNEIEEEEIEEEMDLETIIKLRKACLEYVRKLKKAETAIPSKMKNYNPSHIDETEFFTMGVSVPSDDENDKDYIIISDSDERSSEDEDDGEKLISDEEDDESEEENENCHMRRGTGCDCMLHTEMTECFSCPAAECDNCTWKFYKHDRSKFPQNFIEEDGDDGLWVV